MLKILVAHCHPVARLILAVQVQCYGSSAGKKWLLFLPLSDLKSFLHNYTSVHLFYGILIIYCYDLIWITRRILRMWKAQRLKGHSSWVWFAHLDLGNCTVSDVQGSSKFLAYVMRAGSWKGAIFFCGEYVKSLPNRQPIRYSYLRFLSRFEHIWFCLGINTISWTW